MQQLPFNKVYNQKIYSVATGYAKDTIYARLEITDKGPRYIHLPIGFGYTDEWCGQLVSERIVTRYVNGFPKRVYIKDENAANEALDIRVYNHAALHILNVNWERLKENLESRREVVDYVLKPDVITKPIPKPEPRPTPKPESFRQARRRGWISGWK